MNSYSKDTVTTIQEQQFVFIQVDLSDHVLTITLDRAAKKNALHPQMVNEIAFAMSYAHFEPSIWVIVFQAVGNVFCAGADLKAMAGMAEPHNSSIPEPNGPILIGQLFREVHKPTIAKVTGDVYAGGFFFLAGCSIVIAQDGLKFGLPEVKRGLYPFQVMAALLEVMPARRVIDWCIRGYNLPVQQAAAFGLVTEVVDANKMDERILEIVAELKLNSPTAIRLGLKSYDHIRPLGAQHQYLMAMLQHTIGSKDGQEGLRAFREKRLPNWTGE